MRRLTNGTDDMLVYLICSKLVINTTRDWQKSLSGDELPTFKQLSEFLVQQCQVLESIQSRSNANSRSAVTRFHSDHKQKTFCNAAVQVKCTYCQAEHSIYQCKQFLALTIPQRIKNARLHKLCLNCLRSAAHHTNKCPSGNCRVCSRKHNTLLHLQNIAADQDKANDGAKQVTASSEINSPSSFSVIATHAVNSSVSDRTFLSTAMVFAKGKDNNF